MDLFDLSGKIVIVIGGSKSIGLAMSEAVGSRNATVIIVSRHSEENEAAVAMLRQKNVDAYSMTGDIQDTGRINEIFADVKRRFGRIDVLFNNASVTRRQPIWDVTEKDFDYLVNINLRGTFFSSLNCARIMKEQGHGKIINTASLVSFVAQEERCAYAVTKAAVAHMVHSMAIETGKYGVTINGIAPGLTLTSLNKKRFEEHPEELQAMVSRIALGNPAEPGDFAGAAVFLASEASNHLNGSIISIDGGESCL